jgi:hypothetical protein
MKGKFYILGVGVAGTQTEALEMKNSLTQKKEKNQLKVSPTD